jgi:hypothetical protein
MMRAATARKLPANVSLAANPNAAQAMNYYPHLPSNPMHCERLVNLAIFGGGKMVGCQPARGNESLGDDLMSVLENLFL